MRSACTVHARCLCRWCPPSCCTPQAAVRPTSRRPTRWTTPTTTTTSRSAAASAPPRTRCSLRTAPPHRASAKLPAPPACTARLHCPPAPPLRTLDTPSTHPRCTLCHLSAGARRGRGPGAACAAAPRARGVAAVAACFLAHPRSACARHRQGHSPTRDAAWPRVFLPGCCPELGSRASSHRAGWWLWATPHSQRGRERDRATGHRATASGARASRLQRGRLHRAWPCRCHQRLTFPSSTPGSRGRPTRWYSSRRTR